MKKTTSVLSVAAVAALLTAGGVVGAVSGQAETTTASQVTGPRRATAQNQIVPNQSASKSAATTTSATSGTLTAARTPAELLQLLGERIVAKDLDGIIALHEPTAAVVLWDGSIARGHREIRAMYVEWFKSDPVLTVNPRQTLVAGGQLGSDGKVRNRTASIMGDYTLEQTAPDGTRESFTGNFCDMVRQQSNGTWMYLQDNPYPPHH